MVARRDDWDDDEPRKSRKPKTPAKGPGLLSTPRILGALAVLVIVVLAIGSVVREEDLEFKEIPPQLIGLWTCSDAEKSDFFVEFRRDSIIFGTGGTGKIKCKLIGVNFEHIGDVNKYTLHYRDMGRRKVVRQILVDPVGNELRFTDEANLRWARY